MLKQNKLNSESEITCGKCNRKYKTQVFPIVVNVYNPIIPQISNHKK